MKAKLIKREPAATAATEQTATAQPKPSCPINEVEKWIQDFQDKQRTQKDNARAILEAMFSPAT